MTGYGYLAEYYDRLTKDVDYYSFADFYKLLFNKNEIEVTSIVDLACGTGTLTDILARSGYDMTGVDASAEMLMQANAKNSDILYLHQSLDELDLYGTYDAAICSLDGINYCEPESIGEIFYRINLFLRPGGIFIFDILTPDHFRELDGEIFVDEDEGICCMWRAEFDQKKNACFYGFDIFAQRSDGLYERSSEEHVEYAHDENFLIKELKKSGFWQTCRYGDRVINEPDGNLERIFISAVKK